MSNARKERTLLVIESGLVNVYSLDDRTVWNLGRPSTGNNPEIKMHLPTVSRKHGQFANIDGYWFYFNESDERRTAYNGRYIRKGFGGRKRPVMLNDMDHLVFGSSVDDMRNGDNAVAFYFEKSFEGGWRTIDTRNTTQFTITCDGITNHFENPDCSVLVDSMNGRVVYLGDYTYVTGDVAFTEL